MSDVLEFLQQFGDPQAILKLGGLGLLLFIVFAETGLLIGFIFPGDSLIFISGVVCASRPELLGVDIYTLESLMILSAIIGNVTAYWFGAVVGERLLTRKDSFFFKKSHIETTQIFYKKNGGKTLIIGRFLPIIRSFAPIIAGMIHIDKVQFMIFNIVGALLWIGSLTTTGYLLGNVVWVQEHIGHIVFVLIAVTMIPFLIAYIKNKRGGK